jgi:hypothetical protein
MPSTSRPTAVRIAELICSTTARTSEVETGPVASAVSLQTGRLLLASMSCAEILT